MLNAKKLGIAGGIVWGGCFYLTTLLCLYTGYAEFWLAPWVSVYPGFELSLSGAFVGLLYGFADGFIGLYLLAWIYNKLK